MIAFLQQYDRKKWKIIEKWKKNKTKKQKQKQTKKDYYSTNDEKLLERSQEYYGNLFEDEKTKKVKIIKYAQNMKRN